MSQRITDLLETVKSDKSKMLQFITLPALLIVIFAITYSYTFQSVISLSEESTSTYILAKSIAEGKAFEANEAVSVKSLNEISVGYPFVVAFFMKVFGLEILGLKVLNGLFFLSLLLVLYRLSIQLTKSALLSFVSCLYVLFTFYALKSSFSITSEVLFSLLVFKAIYLWHQIDFSKRSYKNIYWGVIILLATASVYIQLTGLALALTLAVAVIVKKKWDYLATLAGGLILLSSPAYILHGETAVETVESMSFTQAFLYEFPAKLFNAFESTYAGSINMILLFGLTLGVAGVVYSLVKLKKESTFYTVFFLSFIALSALLSPDFEKAQQVFVVIPFVFLFTCFALANLLERRFSNSEKDKKLIRFIPYFLLAYMPVHAGQIESFKSNLNEYSSAYAKLNEMGEWTNDNLPNDAVITCASDKLFHIISDRKVLPLQEVDSVPQFLPYLLKNNVNYIIVDYTNHPKTTNITLPGISTYNGKFDAVMIVEEGTSFIAKFNPKLGYSGSYKNNRPEGVGVMKYRNGNIYEGQWLAGKKSGKGLYFWAKDTVQYRGNWLNNQMHGIGQMRFKDGVTFLGQWENGTPKSMSEVIVPGKGTLTKTKDVLTYFDRYFNK